MNVALACKPSSSQVKAVVMDVRFYIHTIHIFYIFIHEWIHFCCFSNFISCGGHPKTVRCIVFCVLCMLNTKKRKKSNCDDVNMARSTWAAACNFSGGGKEDIIHTDHLYWATDNSVNWPNCGSRTKRPHSYQTKKKWISKFNLRNVYWISDVTNCYFSSCSWCFCAIWTQWFLPSMSTLDNREEYST